MISLVFPLSHCSAVMVTRWAAAKSFIKTHFQIYLIQFIWLHFFSEENIFSIQSEYIDAYNISSCKRKKNIYVGRPARIMLRTRIASTLYLLSLNLSVHAKGGKHECRQNFIILMLGMWKQQQQFIWNVILCVIGHDLNSVCVNLREQWTENSEGRSSSSSIKSNDAFIWQ